MRMNRSVSMIALSLAALAAGAARAQIMTPAPAPPGERNIEGLTVSGKGSVLARPDRLEIDMEVSSASELTADAIVKYRDAKRRLEEAFRDLKLENVSVEERGLLVDKKGAVPSPYYFDYNPNQQTKTEVQLSRKLVVTCSAIGEMDEEALLQLVAKLLDVAQDAGGKVGPQNNMPPYYYYYNSIIPPSGLVRFVLDDFDELQEQAYAEAVADARTRAQRLAKLCDVQLGPVVAVREIEVPGEDAKSSRTNSQEEEEPEHSRLESSKFQEIPVQVELLVRFQVNPSPEPVAREEAKVGGR